MPNLLLPINDLESSVERPVIFDVIRQVMDITQISSETPIRFMGGDGKAAQANSTLTKNSLSENSWAYNNRVTIEVDEDFERDRILSTAIKGNEHASIFLDADVGIAIKPVYSSSEVTIRVSYRSTDRNQANRWRNTIRSYTALMRDVNLHEIGYQYHLPEECLVLLQELHRLRENLAGYGESFNEYFSRRLTTNASVLTNLSGSAGLWAVSERQIRVQGFFEFEGVPDKPEKDGEHDAWVAAFSYKFRYDKPVQCTMVYPIMVHNQLLSEQYRPAEKAYSLQDQLRSFTLSSRAFSEFETDTQGILYQSNLGLDIPSFDEFIPNSIPPATVRVFTALSEITPSEKRELFLLSELGDFNLDGDILEFIQKSEYPYMSRTYESVLCLTLYCGTDIRPNGSLRVSPSLQVLATADLDLRKTNRVRLSLVADFAYLSSAALERLKNYPKAAVKIAKAIDAALSGCGGQADLLGNKLSPKDYLAIGLHPDGSYRPYKPGSGDKLPLGPSALTDPNRIIFGLVQTLFVASRPMHMYPQDVSNSVYTRST